MGTTNSTIDFPITEEAIAPGKMFTIMSFAVLVWDTISTLPTERRVIHHKPVVDNRFGGSDPSDVSQSFNTPWYILNSHLESWEDVFDHFMAFQQIAALCLKIAFIAPAGSIVTIVACSAIFAIRVWAMLVGFLVAEAVILAVATSHFVPLSIPPPIFGCVTIGKPNAEALLWPLIFWGFPLILDTVLVVLTVLRVIHFRRAGATSPILTTFIREAGVYYMVVLFVTLTNFCLDVVPDPRYQSASRSVLHRLEIRSPNNSNASFRSPLGTDASIGPVHHRCGPRPTQSVEQSSKGRKRSDSISLSSFITSSRPWESQSSLSPDYKSEFHIGSDKDLAPIPPSLPRELATGERKRLSRISEEMDGLGGFHPSGGYEWVTLRCGDDEVERWRRECEIIEAGRTGTLNCTRRHDHQAPSALPGWEEEADGEVERST
ncbi:hypothetical protein T439DRAFT_353043 [Meredithblackwellia eburnea MCA 4105]